MSRSCSFFFSSRRRHTRYIGDWSSDVCSSDLGVLAPVKIILPPNCLLNSEARGLRLEARADELPAVVGGNVETRSEERRVGKECRSRGAPKYEKKKA